MFIIFSFIYLNLIVVLKKLINSLKFCIHEPVSISLGKQTYAEDTTKMGNTVYYIQFIMSIKRYTPRYKKLTRFRQPLWIEVRGKIKKFKRQKWERLKKSYYPRKFRFFNQDVATYNLCKSFNDDRFFRLKKTYKYLLQDKQRLQLYYGKGRIRYYQLKILSRRALRMSKAKKLSSSLVFLYLLENRLVSLLYRTGFIFSLLQAKRLIECGHVKIDSNVTNNPIFFLRQFDFVTIDPKVFCVVNINYLKSNFPFFYYRYKKSCCSLISKKSFLFLNNFMGSNFSYALSSLKSKLKNIKHYKEKKSNVYTKKI